MSSYRQAKLRDGTPVLFTLTYDDWAAERSVTLTDRTGAHVAAARDPFPGGVPQGMRRRQAILADVMVLMLAEAEQGPSKET